MKTIALFGVGTGLELYYDLHKNEFDNKVLIIFDNGAIENQTFMGIQVYKPSNIHKYEFKQLIITSRHYIEIYNQLLLLDIVEEKVEVFLPLINF